MSRNNVRGPTSALTEFLRESGITPTTVARRARQSEQQPAAGPSNTTATEEETAQTSPGRRRENREEGYSSDKLDESEHESPQKKRKLGKKATEKLKAKEKEKAKKKKQKGDDDDDDYEEDEYTALSKSAFVGPKSPSKPPVGSFDNCAKCETQFTVTRYTMAAHPPPGFLCHECAKASGADPFKKPAPPRKRKAPENKRKLVSFEDRQIPSLASLCIKIIGNYINDIEALGDIGTVNINEIARVLAKNRSLTSENAQLLYDVRNTSLTFYDATNLNHAAFCTLSSLNPGMQSLRLDFCGRLDDSTLRHWSGGFASLTRLELLGPFLVRVDGWKTFFESHSQLTAFLITQSPRFDVSCMEALAEHCSGLIELRLSEIGKMSDEFLPIIATLKCLTYLDLSAPTTSLSTDAVITLLAVVGPGLTYLNLSNNDLLTDAALNEGVQPHARVLSTLILNELPGLTDPEVAKFFSSFSSNPPMRHISLRRNHSLSDESLNALLAHSGPSLTELDINSWKDISDSSLQAIGQSALELKKLDVGWCRQVDDFVIKAVIEGCKGIVDISCFGCNKLTDNCPRKSGVRIHGFETHTF